MSLWPEVIGVTYNPWVEVPDKRYCAYPDKGE